MALTEQEQQQIQNRKQRQQSKGNAVKGGFNPDQFQEATNAGASVGAGSQNAAMVAGVMEAAQQRMVKARASIMFNQAVDTFFNTGGTVQDAIAYLAYLNGEDTEPVINATLPSDPTIAKLVCTTAIGEGTARAYTTVSLGSIDDNGGFALQMPNSLDGFTDTLDSVALTPSLRLLGGAQ